MRYFALLIRMLAIPVVLFYVSYVRVNTTEDSAQKINAEILRVNKEMQVSVNKMQQDFVRQLNDQLRNAQEEIRRGAQFQSISVSSVGSVSTVPISSNNVISQESVQLENMMPAIIGLVLLLEGFSGLALMKRKAGDDGE